MRYLIILLACLAFTGCFGQSSGEAAPASCQIEFIDKENAGKEIEMKIIVTDDQDQGHPFRSFVGKFDLAEIGKKLNVLGFCEIRCDFKNKDYQPVNPKDLRCPLNCGKRVLVSKKLNIDDIKFGG